MKPGLNGSEPRSPTCAPARCGRSTIDFPRTPVTPMPLPNRLPALFVALGLLAGCASPVIRDTARIASLSPIDVQQGTVIADDTEVLWGGRIVAFDNRVDRTEIEVVAFPLARDQSPLTEAPSEGRFLLVLPGYVESADYAVGRHLTMRGLLAGTREWRVQDRAYLYPVVRGRDVHVWPWGFMFDRRPRVSIGVGIGIR